MTPLPAASDEPFRILVICTGNRARSQMAHGWFSYFGGDRVAVASAGVAPRGVHPAAVRVMAEAGIDISAHTSDSVARYVDDDFDLAVTVCDAAREQCPAFPGAKRVLHRAFADPDNPDWDDDELTAAFRDLRDEIGTFCRGLLADILRRAP